MITVFGRPDSSAVARTMWTIGELGLAHQRIDWGGGFGGNDDPAFRAMSPAGRIPAVRFDDGRTLFESNAIIRFLAATHDPGGLMPTDPFARAEAEAWMEWSGAFERAVSRIRDAYRAPGATADAAAAAAAREMATFHVLMTRLQGRAFVMGDRLTIADLALGVWAHRLGRCPPECALPEMPAFSEWLSRLNARPSFVQHVAQIVSAGPQRLGGATT